MTITEVYYSESKFRALPEGKWPVPTDEFGMFSSDSKIAFEYREYEQALTSAIERSVEFEDQYEIDHLTNYWFTNDKPSDGIYPIPPTEVEIVYCQKRYPTLVRVARIKPVCEEKDGDCIYTGATECRCHKGEVCVRTGQKSPSSKVEEETQEELWKEVINAFYYCQNNEQYLLAEAKMKKHFTLTRKK